MESIAANRRSDPAKLSRLCRGDLDWIVMKCLEKDRQRRYETASGLARDIERYLHDDPVEACPPSVGYRFRKLVRRNKAILTTTALVAVALLLGTGISIWQVICATEAEDRAEKGWEAEKIERHRTASTERKAKERLFEAKVSQAEASQWSGRHGQRFTSLAALAEAAELIPTLDLGPAALLDLRTRAIVSLTRRLATGANPSTAPDRGQGRSGRLMPARHRVGEGGFRGHPRATIERELSPCPIRAGRCGTVASAGAAGISHIRAGPARRVRPGFGTFGTQRPWCGSQRVQRGFSARSRNGRLSL